MKKILKIGLIVLGSLVLIAVVWFGLITYFFSGVHQYTPNPVYSADRSRIIIPTINYDKNDAQNYLQVHIEVQELKSGKALFEIQTNASDRMSWPVSWVDNNTIKLDSSDIGIFCWVEKDSSA